MYLFGGFGAFGSDQPEGEGAVGSRVGGRFEFGDFDVVSEGAARVTGVDGFDADGDRVGFISIVGCRDVPDPGAAEGHVSGSDRRESDGVGFVVHGQSADVAVKRNFTTI